MDHPSNRGRGPGPSELPVRQVSVREVDQKRRSGARFVLLDVREPDEWAYCHIADSELLPMSQIGAEYARLDPHAETVVICHHGMRSLAVARFLHQRGFHDVQSMDGGIDAWAAQIDGSIPRY